MGRVVDPRLEIGVCLGIVVICGFVLHEAATIPPGFFEPLGSAPVPKVTAWSVIALCTIIITRALPRLRERPGVTAYRDHWLDMGVVFVATLVYILALQERATTFAIMTTVFLAVSVGVLTRFKRRLWPAVVLVASITGFGCQYVFTRVFLVDLPGL